MKTKQAAAPVDELVTMAAATMAGDLRDFLLDRMRHAHNPIPWHMRGEADQRATVAATELAVRTWVDKACSMIAAGGQQAARGSLVRLAAKDGLQMQINVAASDPLRHALMDHVGAAVLVVLADAADFQGERSAVPISKDQPDMLEPPDPVEVD